MGPLLSELLRGPDTGNDHSPAANLANSANPSSQIRRFAEFARPPSITAGLEARIRAMAARWQYTPDDLAYALEDARRNPACWLACCAADEELATRNTDHD